MVYTVIEYKQEPFQYWPLLECRHVGPYANIRNVNNEAESLLQTRVEQTAHNLQACITAIVPSKLFNICESPVVGWDSHWLKRVQKQGKY